jgi:hypothetical protein
MFAGILYYRLFFNHSPSFIGSGSTRTTVEQPAWFKRRKKTEPHISYKVNRTNRDELQVEVDRILDKINESGFGSLNDGEKQTLDRAKDILSR